MEENIRMIINEKVGTVNLFCEKIPKTWSEDIKRSMIYSYVDRAIGYMDCLWDTNHITEREWREAVDEIRKVERYENT